MLAIKNKCIELNESSSYVTIVSDISELHKKMRTFEEFNMSNKVKIDWDIKRKDFNKWCNAMKIKNNKIGVF